MDLEKYRNYLFLILLIALYLILDFQTILLLPPQGLHFIRQTDSLSFVANYFKNGLHFFQPQVFNLQSIDGKAACEFPILYYITAILYSIFGEHEFILRLLTFLITSMGFLYLFKLLYLLLNDLVYALGFSFLFISSTVLLHYSINFLPDASAFGFIIIGWYFYFKYLKDKTINKYLIFSFLLFTLASLIKVTYFINPLTAFLSIIVYELTNKTGIQKGLQSKTTLIILFLSSFSIVLGWNLYAIYYNAIHHDTYFLIQSAPIWHLKNEQILEVWDYITNYWYSKYYYQSTFHLFFLIIIFGSIFIKRSEKHILITSSILFFGTLAYFLLFFAQFKDHDYYVIAIIPGILFMVVNAFIAIKNKYNKLINNFITKTLVIIICVLSLNYAREKLIQRQNEKINQFTIIGQKLSGFRYFLDSLEVAQQAKFIILTDQTPNGGLYFINRQGWNVKDTSEASLEAISRYIIQGADYLLLTDNQLINHQFKGRLIDEKDGIRIYDLKN
jgi:4-amino-4-deoxy-L-arabinose transferase-like glycosyltransferase